MVLNSLPPSLFNAIFLAEHAASSRHQAIVRYISLLRVVLGFATSNLRLCCVKTALPKRQKAVAAHLNVKFGEFVDYMPGPDMFLKSTVFACVCKFCVHTLLISEYSNGVMHTASMPFLSHHCSACCLDYSDSFVIRVAL